MNIQELKQARQIIQDNFKLSPADCARVVGYINTHNSHIINNILSGDLSGVPSVLAALGIGSAEKTVDNVARDPVKKPRKRSAADNDTDNIQAVSSPLKSPVNASGMMGDNFTDNDIKDHTNENKAVSIIENIDTSQADILPAVDSEIIPPSDDLPAGFGDTCSQWVEDFCHKHGLDIYHLKSQHWRAACMYIGEHIKNAHILYDNDKIKKNGGRYYSGKKLELLLKLWAYLCGSFNQVPLVSDFINFSGVHPNYFYDYDGRGLSSTSVDIVKKARQIEEGGLGSSVAGGGAGAVGGMFLLKTRHGYSETVTIQHTSSAASVGVGDLPLLTDKKL